MATQAFDRARLARQLTAEVNKIFDGYESALEYDEREARAALEYGQTMPSRKGNAFFTQQGKAKAREYCAGPLKSASDLIMKARAALVADMSRAPSSDALNALQAVVANTHPSAEMLQALAFTYGRENYLVNESIADIARNYKLDVRTVNPTAGQAEALEALTREVARMDPMYIEGESLSVSTARAIALETVRDFEEGRAVGAVNVRQAGAGDVLPDGATFSIEWPE